MIFFPLSRDVERLVRLGFVSFKLCACQGLALLLCSQLQLDLSLALLFPLLYIHFDFPVVSAPGIALNSEGVPRTYLKTRCMWVSVCGCAWHECVPQCTYRCQRTCAPWFSFSFGMKLGLLGFGKIFTCWAVLLTQKFDYKAGLAHSLQSWDFGNCMWKQSRCHVKVCVKQHTREAVAIWWLGLRNCPMPMWVSC